MNLILMAMAATAATHSVQIDHRGSSIQAVYSAQTRLSTRTVGAGAPNRMDDRRCLWTATISVERRLTHSPALARTLSTDRQISGTQPGACVGNRKAIEGELARRDELIRDHLTAVAQQDHAPLLAELDAARNLASN